MRTNGLNRETMTSRQRVATALRHEIPDRMPIDLGMYTASGISAFAYKNLREYLNLSTDSIEIHDGVQVLARVDEDILRMLHCDCILLKPRPEKYASWNPRAGYRFLTPDYYRPEINENGDWVVRRGDKKMRMPVGGYFFDGDWLNIEDTWDEIYFLKIVKEAERIYKETDYFTAFKGFYPYYEQNMDYYCKMLTDPDELIESNKIILRRELERAALFMENMKEYVGAICMSGDLGSQQSPLCKPDVFEEIVLPFMKQFCDFIHRNSDLKIFLHTCGAIEPLIPLLIECGIDILNPVQISANGMNPETLKEKYGKSITFWGGGVDTQRVLGSASTEKITENVQKLVNTFKPGGGYVFCPVHNIMGNVEPSDIITVYSTAYKNSFYSGTPEQQNE